LPLLLDTPKYLFISLYTFSISPCKWRNRWSTSPSILFVSPRKNRCLLDDRLQMKKKYLFISLYTFSISPCKWRNRWRTSPSILFVSPRKNRYLLDDRLQMKKNIYLYLSIPFPFLHVSGEMDEALHLVFYSFLLEKSISAKWSPSDEKKIFIHISLYLFLFSM
jgi:hypothetical protein